MNGYANKCDVCGKVEFVDCECHKDGILPKDWISMRCSKYVCHFCSVDCAIKWLKEQEAEK